MNSRSIRVVLPAVGVWMALCGVLPPGAAAQEPAPKNQAMPRDRTPGEIQRLFDAYTVMQAQQVLGLSDEKFAVFLPRLRDLQQVRRKHDMARQQMVGRLGRLAGAEPFDESQVRDALKALADQDATYAVDLRQAYEALDQTLDLRQQARFRLFEQQMERRKFDLVVRARRGGNPGPPPGGTRR